MKKSHEVIDFIKRQLNLNDPKSHNQASFILLKSLRENKEEKFVKELVDSNVMIDVFQIINPENQRYILECLEIITESSVFLKNELVHRIITRISQCDFMNSEEEATIVINICHTIVEKAFEFDESKGIPLIQQHADELFNFITQATFNCNSMLFATKLLNFIIRYSAKKFKQKHFSTIRSIHTMAVEYLLKNQINSLLERMRTICCISTSVINLCHEIDNINTEHKESLFDSIKLTTIEEVIPVLQNLEIDIESAEDFIDFLESVISLRDYKDKEVCYHLCRNRYLKYLLELSVSQPKRYFFRMKVCRVISKLIVALKEKLELPVDDWPGGSTVFQNYFCTGLESLPVDLNQWEELLKTHVQESNSLLVLVYCHFIATNERYIFMQKSLAVKLTSSVRQWKLRSGTEPIFLKALWLLYSVSASTSEILNSPSNPRLHSKATKNLATVLQKGGSIELYYTHHRDVLLYCIREIGIPEGLRLKVIRLWLDRSNRDEEFDAFVKECLDQNYDELKIVKLLMIIVHENYMTNLNNTLNAYGSLLRFKEIIPEDVVEFVLKTLAEDLANYTPSNSSILKTVLRFVCTLPTSKTLPSSIVRKCARDIGKIVIRKDTDRILKILLITAGAFAIRNSVVLNDCKVAEIFLKNDEFLKEVLDSGFFLENLTVTHVCIRTLTCLIFCQDKFNLECKSVSQLTFKDLENLLVKQREENCSPILGVEFIKLLLLGSVIDNPLIVLKKLEKNKDLNHIFNVYFLIHTIHDEAVPGKEGECYQCLSAMLNYCYTLKLNINVFLACAATSVLMEIAIERISKSNQPNSAFLDFAITWLKYRQSFREHTGMKIKSYAEEPASLLIEFRTVVTKMQNINSILVEDFCTTVDNYLRDY